MEKRVFIYPTEPSLARFKSHLRLTGDDLDAELSDNLLAAIRSAEATIGKVISPSYLSQEFRFRQTLRLHGPVIEILDVKVDGSSLEPEDYSLKGGCLEIAAAVSGERVEVEWKAGMDQVPPDIIKAILLKGAHLFNNPGDAVDVLVSASDNLLRPYRTWGLDDEDC